MKTLLPRLVFLLLLAPGASALEYRCPDGTVCQMLTGCPCIHRCANGAPVTDPKLCRDEGPGLGAEARCRAAYRIAGDAIVCTRRADLAEWSRADDARRAVLRAENRCFPIAGLPVNVAGEPGADPSAPLEVEIPIETGDPEKAWTVAGSVEKCS